MPRHSPLGPAPNKQQQRPSSSSSTTTTRRHLLLDALESNDSQTRAEACYAVANSFEPLANPEEAKKWSKQTKKELNAMLKDGLVVVLNKRLGDAEALTRLGATGAMRNLILTGGERVVAAMQHADTFTMLEFALLNGIQHPNQDTEIALVNEVLRVIGHLCQESPTLAEKRLPRSLQQGGAVAAALQVSFAQEQAVMLLHGAMESNTALATCLANTSQCLAMLNEIATKDEQTTTSSSTRIRACGILIDACLAIQSSVFISAYEYLSTAIHNVFVVNGGDDGYVMNIWAPPAIVEAARALDQGDVESESVELMTWLDQIQCRALAFDVVSSCTRNQSALTRDKTQTLCTSIFPLAVEIAMLLPSFTQVPPTIFQPMAELQKAAANCICAFVEHGHVVPNVSLLDRLAGTLHGIGKNSVGDVIEYEIVRDRVASLVDAYACVLKLLVASSSLLGTSSSIDMVVNGLEQLCALPTTSMDTRLFVVGALSSLGQVAPFVSVVRALQAVIANESECVVVALDAADGIIDMFSSDAHGDMYVALGLDAVMVSFAHGMSGRINALKLSDATLYDEFEERMREVAGNVTGFVKWKAGGG